MKADLPDRPPVKDVHIAVAPRPGKTGEEELWDIYLVNTGPETLHNVLVTSQGYGTLDGRDKTTTVLRHFYDTIDPDSYIKVEPIQRVLFGITNEYWVSFNRREHMLDKKYVFRPGDIGEDRFERVPVLNRQGVLKS